MPYFNPFHPFALGNLFDTVLPDFVLAFAFFTSIVYAVLGRRFGQQRPAVAMSAALGAALSIGLVWWEYSHGLSIRDLGPIAVGFAVLILAGVIYQSVRGIGGSWAGAGIALGASLLVGWALGLDWHVDRGIVQTIITVTLVVGVMAFLLHRRGHLPHVPSMGADLGQIRHDMSDLYQDRQLNRGLSQRMQKLKREAHDLRKEPDKHRDEAVDIILQLQRILPAEGWLTERLSRLRAKAHHARRGTITRIEDLQKHLAQLPPEARKQAARALKDQYKELNVDRRLERLDAAVAENERRIRDLTRRAQQYMETHDYRNLAGVLDAASKLQQHNSKLFAIINRTEARLMAAAKQAAQQTQGVKRA